jgi:uncharacterized protein (TIGR00251 family)
MIDGLRGGALLVRVTAPPVDGAANSAVIEVLAGAFDVPRTAIEIVKGSHGRNKIVAIRGMSREQLLRRLTSDE